MKPTKMDELRSSMSTITFLNKLMSNTNSNATKEALSEEKQAEKIENLNKLVTDTTDFADIYGESAYKAGIHDGKQKIIRRVIAPSAVALGLIIGKCITAIKSKK